MMISVSEFRPEHLDQINLIEDPNNYVAYFPREYLVAQYVAGPAYTMFRHWKPVVCGGFIPISPGVASAWVWVDREVEKNHELVKQLYIHSNHLINKLYVNYGIHRVQAYVFQNRPRAARFVENLGFYKECTMQYYGPSAEHVDLYALITMR